MKIHRSYANPLIIAIASLVLGRQTLLAQDLYVGSNSSGVTTTFTSGTNNFNNTYVGYATNASNNLLGSLNANTLLQNSGDLILGVDGSSNAVVVSNGATLLNGVNNYGSVIGQNADSSNNVELVTGTNSLWTNSGDLIVGMDVMIDIL